jgi:hypothetical protein
MKHRLTRIDPHQAGKVAGCVAGLSTMVLVPFLFVVSANIPLGFNLGGLYLLSLPVLYALFAYLWIALAALLYNWAAKTVGHLEFDIEPTHDD